jgi:hypothetical protein
VKRSLNNNWISFEIIKFEFIARSELDDEWGSQILIQPWTLETTNKKSSTFLSAEIIIAVELKKLKIDKKIKLYSQAQYSKRLKSIIK